MNDIVEALHIRGILFFIIFRKLLELSQCSNLIRIHQYIMSQIVTDTKQKLCKKILDIKLTLLFK